MMVHCFKVAPMEKFDNFTCGRIDLMGDIVTKSAPYLYPFLIEFSLIGAGVLLIMWARIGKNPRWIILWNTFGWLKFSSNILNQYRCKSIPWAKHRGELYRKYPEIDHSSKKAIVKIFWNIQEQNLYVKLWSSSLTFERERMDND